MEVCQHPVLCNLDFCVALVLGLPRPHMSSSQVPKAWACRLSQSRSRKELCDRGEKIQGRISRVIIELLIYISPVLAVFLFVLGKQWTRAHMYTSTSSYGVTPKQISRSSISCG